MLQRVDEESGDWTGSELLLFDQVFQQESHRIAPKQWTQWLTYSQDLVQQRITGACYLLDKYLLLGTQAGLLWAKPRNNPRSTYFVTQTNAAIHQLSGLHNVVATMTEHSVLRVIEVEPRDADPFIRMSNVLFEDKMADVQHAPLLYGPYVMYRRLDGKWVRLQYDGPVQRKLEIRIPNKAGWPILTIKAANWRYWTVVLENPESREREDYVLLAGGAKIKEENFQTNPFLVGGAAAVQKDDSAGCVVCGEEATLACTQCEEARYCKDASEMDSAHAEHWEQHRRDGHHAASK